MANSRFAANMKWKPTEKATAAAAAAEQQHQN